MSTHRHNLPPEGGLQMFSDIWKTIYLSKERHMKQYEKITQKASGYWSTPSLYTPPLFFPLNSYQYVFDDCKRHSGPCLLPSNTLSMVQASHRAPVWSSLHHSCFHQHLPPMFRGKEARLQCTANFIQLTILHGITKHRLIKKKKIERTKLTF